MNAPPSNKMPGPEKLELPKLGDNSEIMAKAKQHLKLLEVNMRRRKLILALYETVMSLIFVSFLFASLFAMFGVGVELDWSIKEMFHVVVSLCGGFAVGWCFRKVCVFVSVVGMVCVVGIGVCFVAYPWVCVKWLEGSAENCTVHLGSWGELRMI